MNIFLNNEIYNMEKTDLNQRSVTTSEADRFSAFKLHEFPMKATGKSKMKVALIERVEITFCDVAFVIFL